MKKTQTLVASFPGYDIIKPQVCSLTGFPVFKDDDTVALPSRRAYKIFTFGSVASYALESGDCPIASYENAVSNGHKTHWLNANAVVLSNMKTEKPIHYEINIGDEIMFEGIVFKVEKDWNDNLKLVKIGTKKEIIDKIFAKAS